MPLTLSEFAILLALLSAASSLLTGAYPRLMRKLVFPLLGISGILCIISAFMTMAQGLTITSTLPLGLPWLQWQLRLDPLTALFLLIIGAVVVAVAFYGPSYVREFQHGKDPLPVLGGFTGLFIAGMIMVVHANDAYMFMISWEIMSLSSYFLVAFQHDNPANRRAAFLYLLMAHVGALFILLGYAVLAGFGDGFTFDGMRANQLTASWASVAFFLALIGFGMKAGILPLHAWLPEAHPVAPSHISALMSGVMLKVAIYGFIRFTYDLLGVQQTLWFWGVAVLIIGSATALIGVLYALMQTDIKRVLAYSSIENVGIIFIGLGLSLIFYASGHAELGILGLIAALFHCLNHALFKGLLFLGAGAVLNTCHERNLEHMGGLLNRMPWTGAFMLVGCLSIAALPPFNGFVSEWLTFQAALQEWAMEEGILRFVIPSSAAVLALTGALALTCFVRMYGIAFLGLARSRRVRRAKEVSRGMRIGQGMLATCCILLGLFPTSMLQLINSVPMLLTGTGLDSLGSHGWAWLTPISQSSTDAVYSASYSAPLVVLTIGVVWYLMSLLLHRGEGKKIQRCEPWDCGFSRPDSRMQYTATAFSQPFQRIFAPLFELDESIEKSDRTVRYRLSVGDRFWTWLYLPLARLVLTSARKISTLQSGNIRSYLAWSLGTLVLLLWIIS